MPRIMPLSPLWGGEASSFARRLFQAARGHLRDCELVDYAVESDDPGDHGGYAILPDDYVEVGKDGDDDSG